MFSLQKLLNRVPRLDNWSPKQKKVLNVVLWVLGAVTALIVIALSALQLYVNSNKQAFVKLVNGKLNEAVSGTAAIKDVEINVWRHFPNVDVRLVNVVLKDSVYNKPLLQVKYVSTRLNVLRLISSQVDIHNIYIEDGKVHLFKDKNGYSNTYLFNKKEGAKKEGKPATIDEVELRNVSFVTEDAIKNKWYGLQANYLHANLEYADSIIHIDLEENILVKGLGFNLQKGYFLKDKTVAADWQLTFNRQSKHLSIPETSVRIGKAGFSIKGDFYLPDTVNSHFKLVAKAKNIKYKEASSLVSANIQQKVNLVELTRPLQLTATIEGPMAFRTVPIVNVQWVAKNNQLVTPAITLDECSFTGSFTNERNRKYPRTDDNSEIMLANLKAKWGGLVLVANTNAIVTNLVNPVLQFDVTSTTTLAALDEKLDLATLNLKKGGALLNVQYNGPLGTDPALMQYLSGNLVIKDAEVDYTPRNLTFSNCNGEIFFSHSDLLVRNLQCDLNTNHFKVDVVGQNVNVLAATSLPGEASIICTVFTPSLDLTDFKSLFAARRTTRRRASGGVARPAVQLDDVLENGTLEMRLKANALHMKRFTANNVQANVSFNDNDMDIRNVSLQHADGRLKMDAKIHQVSPNYHQATANLNLNHLNVQKLFYAFNNFGMISLTSDKIRGSFSSDMQLKLGIDGQGNLIKNSMQGGLHFSLKKGRLINFEPLENIQKLAFKDRDFSTIEFAELKDSLELRKDKVYIHRMEVESSVLTLFVEGIYSFGNDTDISIQVPLSNLKKRDEDYEVKNRGADRKVGASVYLRAKGTSDGSVKIGLDVFKKLRNDNFEKEFREN